MFFSKSNIPIQAISISDKINLHILRLDMIDEFVSGNKFFKLKYNIEEAKNQNYDTLLTFGGAYSNHIAAVAAAGKKSSFKTIGVIRGEEHTPLNPTLQFAKENGMELYYMDRESYRAKNSDEIIARLKEKWDDFYLIPEGGTNDLAIKGTEEITDLIDFDFDYICCPIGTGGTIAGLINAVGKEKKVVGFSALKGEFIHNEIKSLIRDSILNYDLHTTYHFGGYAKVKLELIEFINSFKVQHGIPLGPIYTGKMMYGIFDLIGKDYFKPNSTIVAIHTGGLQGIEGFNERNKKYQIV